MSARVWLVALVELQASPQTKPLSQHSGDEGHRALPAGSRGLRVLARCEVCVCCMCNGLDGANMPEQMRLQILNTAESTTLCLSLSHGL